MSEEAGTFLVCGLPRSRTAWVANFLTHGLVRCGHELSAEVRSVRELAARLGGGGATGLRVVGNADTAQALYLPELRRLLPEAKVVVLWREPAEVVRSLRRQRLPRAVEAVRALVPFVEAAAGSPGALVLPVEALDEVSGAQALWQHVAPGERFDRGRWEMLREMKVEVRDARLQALVALR